MKQLNLRLLYRYARVKWYTNSTQRKKLNFVFQEEDNTLSEFDHNPLHGIDDRFRDQNFQ
jgi:hypothetical protein